MNSYFFIYIKIQFILKRKKTKGAEGGMWERGGVSSEPKKVVADEKDRKAKPSRKGNNRTADV